jgi:two-component system, chemotaxis family, response regulator Rcp1
VNVHRTPHRAVKILLVEDNPADVLLTKESFTKSKTANEVGVVTNGAAALRFLRRKAPYTAAERPDLILLDLNLPTVDGREVLSEIKTDPDLKSIPVVVLTTSADERDILRAYELNANCYVTKPMNLHEFVSAVRAIDEFWLGHVGLPKA